MTKPICGECLQTEDKCPGPFGACGNAEYEEWAANMTVVEYQYGVGEE